MARSKRRSKAKFRWTKELIIMLSLIVVMIVATLLLGISSDSEKLYKKYAGAQTSSQTALAEDNVYKEITFSDLVKKIKNNEYVYVYYGTASNTTFLDNIQAVNSAAEDNKVKRVYILSSSWAENLDVDDEDDGKANQDKLDAREAKLDDVDMKQVPSLWVFKNGKVVFDSYKYLNDDYQKAGWSYVIQQAFANPERLAKLD